MNVTNQNTFSPGKLFLANTTLFLLFFNFQLLGQLSDANSTNQFVGDAKVLIDSFRLDEALQLLNRSLDVRQQISSDMDTAKANIYYLMGKVWRKKGKYNKALNYHQMALKIRKGLLGASDDQIGQSLNEIGIVLVEKGKFSKALEYHENALRIYESADGRDQLNLAYTLQRIGVVYDYKWQFRKALNYYNKSLSLYKINLGENSPEVALCYSCMAIVFELMGDLDAALHYNKKAIKRLLNHFGRNNVNVAHCYNNLGIVYRLKSDYEQALDAHQKALSIRLNFFGFEHPQTAASYNNLAVLYSAQGAYKEALQNHWKVLEIRQMIYGEQHYKIASSYSNIGSSYFDLKNFDQALEYFEKAHRISIATLGPFHDHVASSYFNLGMALENLGNLNEASEYFAKSYEIRLRHLGENHHKIADALHHLAVTAKKNGEFEKAFGHYQESLEIRKSQFGENHPTVAYSYKGIATILAKNCRFREALNYLDTSLEILTKTLGQNHLEIADVFDMMSQIHQKLGNYKKAIQFSQKAISIVDEVPGRYQSDMTKRTHLSDYHGIFQQAVDVLVEASETLDGEFNLDEAFIASEKAKSKLLLSALTNSRTKSFAGVPKSLIRKEYELAIKIDQNEKKLFEELDKGAARNDTAFFKCNDNILKLRADREKLLKKFEHEAPNYYKLRYDTDVISIEKTQKLLQKEQALIEYLIGDSVIYTFIITKDQYRVVQIAKDFPLQEWVDQLQVGLYKYHLLSTKSPNDYVKYNDTLARASFNLHQRLIGPIESYLPKKLILIPDGVINYIPFESLIAKMPENIGDYRSYPYMIHKYQIQYCYSATLLEQMRLKRSKRLANKFLGFAPAFEGKESPISNFETRRTKMGPLKHNISEVEGIQPIFGGEVVIGKQAIKSRFLEVCPRYNILHLATHAKANNDFGDYSYLLFENSSDSTNEERLYASELYNLELNAKMVVLSACETGIGQLERGEGLISLARAFSYAGARSIISSLWTVDDFSTKEMMKSFYQYLKKGQSKDTALRRAKLDYLKNHPNDEVHPFYWAGFIPIGDMEPVYCRADYWWKWLLVLGFLTIAFFGYLSQRKHTVENSGP